MRTWTMGAVLLSLILAEGSTQDPKTKKKQLKDGDVDSSWVYDNLRAAVRIAKKKDKPLFVVFR